MMEEYWGDFYTPPRPSTGATPKGQTQSAPAPVASQGDVTTQLRESITITAPAPVFKKRSP